MLSAYCPPKIVKVLKSIPLSCISLVIKETKAHTVASSSCPYLELLGVGATRFLPAFSSNAHLALIDPVSSSSFDCSIVPILTTSLGVPGKVVL